jgi:hypothetical protein
MKVYAIDTGRKGENIPVLSEQSQKEGGACLER